MLKELFEEHEELIERIQEAVAQRISKTGIFDDISIQPDDHYATLSFDEDAITLKLTIETDVSKTEENEEALSDRLNEVFDGVISDYMSDDISKKIGSVFECDDIMEVTTFEVDFEE